jgi:hypothetical protein
MVAGVAVAARTSARNHQRLSFPAKAGNPVRRGFSVQSLLPLEYWVARSRLRPGFAGQASRAMTSECEAPSLRAKRSNPSCRTKEEWMLRRFAPRNDGTAHFRILAARSARVLKSFPPVRAWGMPGAQWHPQPVCIGSKHTVVTTGPPEQPGIPAREWF